MIHPSGHTWETRLIELAQEALASHTPGEPLGADQAQLEAAYLRCTEVTREHSRTFFLASSLLTPDKQHAIRALYAFCRTSDDLVDRPGDASTQPALAEWKQVGLTNLIEARNPVALAWADTIQRFCVPRRYAEQLIDGVMRDTYQTRYATFEDLASYCYGVASTVGLMAMHIIGYAGQQAIPYAVKLGVALQLTNILRDIGEDWQKGRLYLPQEDLEHFGLSEQDIAAARLDQRWQALMQFQIERARRLYAEAMPGIAYLNADGRFAVMAAAVLYRDILQDIERHDYDVFTRRAYISSLGKLSRLPSIWWRSVRATV